MRRKYIVMIIVWLCWGILLGGIYYLSSQNGEQTAKTSMTFTQKIAGVVYENPTETQINDLHMVLRKEAHLALFLLLGLLTTWVCAVSCPWKSGALQCSYILIATVITLGCAYFDEWHKQFIQGRHFDHAETLINMGSGLIGVLLAVGMILISRIVRKNMES